MEEVRLQKYLAECGIASRRKCEEYIKQRKVEINGIIITELGTKVNPEKDKIKFEGKEVSQNNKLVYILLNKPIGYVTTSDEQFGREKVLDLVKIKERIVPVGRLDMYTSGALILTNDGDFVYKVTHPKHEITKTYTVTIKGIIKTDEVDKLRKGVDIDGYITKPAKVKILKTDTEKNISRLEIIIHEGKNRQVRRMCESIGKRVIALHRSKIGNISVKDIELGKWRYLKNEEVADILRGSKNKCVSKERPH
ncbi:MAG: rRNA pseudouridine synthase [Clostridia bacterium]|nr:rRNA pseudouridine synthase [Clostridia bacterium]